MTTNEAQLASSVEEGQPTSHDTISDRLRVSIPCAELTSFDMTDGPFAMLRAHDREAPSLEGATEWFISALLKPASSSGAELPSRQPVSPLRASLSPLCDRSLLRLPTATLGGRRTQQRSLVAGDLDRCSASLLTTPGPLALPMLR